MGAPATFLLCVTINTLHQHCVSFSVVHHPPHPLDHPLDHPPRLGIHVLQNFTGTPASSELCLLNSPPFFYGCPARPVANDDMAKCQPAPQCVKHASMVLDSSGMRRQCLFGQCIFPATAQCSHQTQPLGDNAPSATTQRSRLWSRLGRMILPLNEVSKYSCTDSCFAFLFGEPVNDERISTNAAR